tara:strand:+ start:1718 stop:2230 length:513 start_codon:yes stop_codon:yes gene_type:complete
MFKNFFHVFNKNKKLVENINFHIVNQSRKQDLYILFKIEDNFQNRLNLQILHLSLILLSLNLYKDKYYLEKKLFKAFLNNFDLDFREKGLGDKIIEKKIFEISNLVNYQFFQYKESINDKKLLKISLNEFFIFSAIDNKISSLESYVHKQSLHLQKLNFNSLLDKKIFLD